MAPMKRSREGQVATPVRVTRSSARRLRSGSVPTLPPPPEPEPEKKAKKAKTVKQTVKVEVVPGGKTIVIEHCKQCKSFSERANQVKNGLKDSVPGITVIVNPEKPRKGCFEIREEGGEKFITLLDMPRPFKPMKDLDMEKVISDIIEKTK